MDNEEKQFFQWSDYLVFVFMLVICMCIGIYFGFVKVSKNVTDYLVGNRNMSVWPVAISLVVSHISGISFLGLTTEMYVYGIQYLYQQLDFILTALIGHTVFLPVFIELQVTSTYEYLERRFDSSLRKFGSILFIVGVGLWLPVVIYVPALALSHATGVNVHVITPIVCSVCIFYTCVGGIRAVVWTDFLQAFMMLGSVILVIVKGTINVGGLGTVFDRNYESGRLEAPDMELSLTKRLTFMGLLLGGTFSLLTNGVLSQMMMQRYVSLPSLKDAKKALWLFLIIKSLFVVMCCYTGLLTYATFYNCDPISTKVVAAKDQLLPLLVINTLQGIPGTAGLFLAGIVSASLSSLSSGLNSLAAVILEDCYKPFFKRVSPRQEKIVAKSSVVIIGIITVCLAFLVEKLGTILQLSNYLNSVTSGPLAAIFLLGLLVPWVTAKGVYYGGLCGLSFMLWIVFGSQTAIARGAIKFEGKPVSTEGCTFNVTTVVNKVQSSNDISEDSELFYLYRISFVYYTFIGMCLTMVASLIISFVTGANKPEDVDPAYLAPFIRRFIKSKKNNQVQENVPEYIDLLDTTRINGS